MPAVEEREGDGDVVVADGALGIRLLVQRLDLPDALVDGVQSALHYDFSVPEGNLVLEIRISQLSIVQQFDHLVEVLPLVGDPLVLHLHLFDFFQERHFEVLGQIIVAIHEDLHAGLPQLEYHLRVKEILH